ncbi:hypothetical protein CONLIGDRAFT_517047, partial [Coniochaeta ligniaria NRRL 30616]
NTSENEANIIAKEAPSIKSRHETKEDSAYSKLGLVRRRRLTRRNLAVSRDRIGVPLVALAGRNLPPFVVHLGLLVARASVIPSRDSEQTATRTQRETVKVKRTVVIVERTAVNVVRTPVEVEKHRPLHLCREFGARVGVCPTGRCMPGCEAVIFIPEAVHTACGVRARRNCPTGG